MSHRELKRVPMDFNWPLNRIWKGYINPFPGDTDTCQFCDLTGFNPATLQLHKDFYDLDETGTGTRYQPITETIFNKIKERIIQSGRGDDWNWKWFRFGWRYSLVQEEIEPLIEDLCLRDLTHTFSRENGWVRREDNYIPTVEEANIYFGYAPLALGTSTQYLIVQTRAKRLGIFGLCSHCDGKGEIDNRTEKEKNDFDNWQPEEPPKGDGWQIWSSTGTEKPITPVFKTPEELARHCSTKISLVGNEYVSYEIWLNMIQSDTVNTGSLLTI